MAKKKPQAQSSEASYDLNEYLSNIGLYQYGDVAARLGSNKATAQFAVGGLEALTEALGKKLKEKGLDSKMIDGFKAGTMASKEGIGTAINSYAKNYSDALGKLKMTDFYTLRYEQFKYALGEEKANEAKEKFEKYKDEIVGSIRKKVRQSNAILEDENELFDEAKKTEAKETIEKYMAIYNLIDLPEQINFEKLTPSATKDVYKEMITESLSKA